MAELFDRLNEDIAFVQKLGDNPNSENGLTAEELKEWFDKAPLVIQTYLNRVFIPQIEAKFGSVDQWILQADKRFDSFIAGTGFLPVDGSAGMNADLPMNGHRITMVSAPTGSKDATNKEYVDAVGTVANEAAQTAKNAKETADSKCGRKSDTVVLRTAGWSGKLQVVSASGVLEDKNACDVFASPIESDREKYSEFGVRCTDQGNNTLTFTCDNIPDANLEVAVVILT